MEEAVQLHEGVRPLGVGGHGDSADSKIQIQKNINANTTTNTNR